MSFLANTSAIHIFLLVIAPALSGILFAKAYSAQGHYEGKGWDLLGGGFSLLLSLLACLMRPELFPAAASAGSRLLYCLICFVLGFVLCVLVKKQNSKADQSDTSNQKTVHPKADSNMPVSSDVYTGIGNFCSIARMLHEECVRTFGPDGSALMLLNISGSCKDGDTGMVECSFDGDRAGIEINLMRLGYQLAPISWNDHGWYLEDASTLAFRMENASGFREMIRNMGGTQSAIEDGLLSLAENNLCGFLRVLVSVTLSGNAFSFSIRGK